MKMWRTQYLLFIHCSELHLFINSSPFNLCKQLSYIETFAEKCNT